MAINPTLYGTIPFDPQKDFEPIARVASFAIVLAAHPGAGFKTVPELIAKAKAAPGTINFASTGVGSPQHLAAELLQSSTGIRLVHVPYRGGGPATIDLIAGHVPLGFIGIPPLAPAIQEGKLVGVGVTSKSRSPLLPDVPSVAESLPDFEARVWFGLFAPKGTPKDVLDRLQGAMAKTMRSAAVTEMLRKQGFDAFPASPDELRAFLAEEIARWGEAVRKSGAKVQ
jgi:tripartite-type tricarboxylate transporter receptor subunit TctC